MSETTSTTGTSSLVELRMISDQGRRRLWGAYGVVHEDGGLSWSTYPDPESAKRDPNYRGQARIVRLRMEDVGTECQREPGKAEKLMRQIEEEQRDDERPQQAQAPA